MHIRLRALAPIAQLRVLAVCLTVFAISIGTARAQSPPAVPGALSPPDTIARGADGAVTLRATRLAGRIAIDGALDEAVYGTVPPASGFLQIEPTLDAPATEQTDIWVFFDDNTLYITARCWDSAPPKDWVANEMRRDHPGIGNGELVGVLLDTFHDRRNAVVFNVNPIGGRVDSQLTNESFYNVDWNPIWEVRTGRFAGGWTAEMAIPFKTLRYRQGDTQVWGINVLRVARWKNELSTLTPPRALGIFALAQVSRAATLVGLEVPDGSRNLEIKPSAITNLATDRLVTPPISNDVDGDVSLDVKYGITENLVADLTVNTDFAQVEADEQQINLTRFSLFFPEKREFFLEGSGNFDFSGGQNMLFFSRQIGLQAGREVPIVAGGRLTGKAGPYSVGVLHVRTGDAPAAGARATDFSIVRVKRDVLRRSSVGALVTRRSVSTIGDGSNVAMGLDGTFAFFNYLRVDTYVARTRTPGLTGDDTSHRASVNYGADRYGLTLDRQVVGARFNPQVGFLPRTDFRSTFASVRFSPRPKTIAAVRRFTMGANYNRLTNGRGRLESEYGQASFGTEFQRGDVASLAYSTNVEVLVRPFPIAPGVTIPIGSYRFRQLSAFYNLGAQRRLSGSTSFQHGGFYNGTRTGLSYRGRLEVTPQLSVEPALSFNRIALAAGTFMTRLVTARTTYTMTPAMFASALVQYNSSTDGLSTNLRFRWEYRPGSEFFVVYNEERDLDPLVPDRWSLPRTRALVVKVNRLLRF